MKKMVAWKKSIAAVAICSMVASVANAISWAPAQGNDPDVGLWNDVNNWGGSLPGADEKTQFSSSVGTECIVDAEVFCGQLVLGDGGLPGQVKLRIVDGGILNAKLSGGSWAGVGYNRSAYCTVEAGGTFNVGTRLGVGMVDGGLGLLEVYGDIALTGVLQVSNGGGDGTVKLYGGGTISASGLEMAGDSALIDIWQDGLLTLAGDLTNTVAGFIADGKIIGNRLTNNLDVALVVDAGVTNTVITAIDSIPNLAGLTEAEAAEVLAVFGYVVGTITEGSAPGGITGRVAATDPAAGSAPLAEDSAINLIIQEAGEIPDVVGLEYMAASNLLVQSGYIIGIETEVYVFDSAPGLVTEQDPAGGTEATPGDAVNITFNERLAASSINTATVSGDWMNDTAWDALVAPYKDVQNFEVHIEGGTSMSLTNFAAVRRLHLGDTGGGSATIAQLDVMEGAHLVSGLYNNYIAVGWNAGALLNVHSNAIFESRAALRVGWNGSSATINIDGGSVISASWMSLGKADKIDPGTQLPYTSEINISNGGSLLIDYFRDENYRNGHINLAEGSFATTGENTGDIDAGLASGFIVVAEGYVSSVDVIDGNATLSSYLPGYAGWASKEGIGSENEDEDEDLRDNLYEYALNGDPKDPLDLGVDPVMMDEDGVLTYTYLSRADDTNLVYTVLTTDDLVNGTWTDTGTTVVGTNVTGEDYNVITNEISTVENVSFIKLEITNP